MKLACLQVKAHDWKHAEQSWSDLKAKIVAAAREHDLVLVPECAYPAYFLCPFDRPQEDPDAEVEEEIRAIARTTQTYIAFGYAQGRENKAILVDPQGQVISEKSKSYLWHFDHRWFEPGEELALADTKFGRLALIICADGRMPELVRMAALEGAVLVLDLANLTATGLHMEALTNAQVSICWEFEPGRTESGWQWRTSGGWKVTVSLMRADLPSIVRTGPAWPRDLQTRTPYSLWKSPQMKGGKSSGHTRPSLFEGRNFIHS